MKKNKLRALLAGGVAVAMLCGVMAVTALADTGVPTVTYNHANKQFEFRNVSTNNETVEEGYPNLFQELTNLMPGDEKSQEIKVNASGLGSGSVVIWLKAESSKDPEAQADYAKLLTAMDEQGVTLSITEKDGKPINDVNGDPVTELSAKLSEGLRLGRFYGSDDERNLVVKLSIPVTVGNEFQGLAAGIDWVFTAQYEPGGDGGDGGGGGTDITDPETPLGDLPELEKGDHFAYIVGRDDGKVHPEDEINRAEVATIFFRLLKEDSRNQYWMTTNPYSDVPADAWFNKAVSTLTNAKIIYGRSGGIFDPNAPITRAEFAAMAVRFFGSGYDGPDMFSDISGHWAQDVINKAANEGIISGYTDGTFRPDNNITRAEAISIINRVLDRRPHADHLLDGMTTWPDNMDTSAWYYTAIQEATNSHNYDPSEERDENDNQFEIWTELLPVRDWATLERAWTDSNASANPGDVMYVSSSESYVVK